MNRPYRQCLKMIRAVVAAYGGDLPLEKAADMLDVAAMAYSEVNKSSTDDKPDTLASMTPAKGKH